MFKYLPTKLGHCYLFRLPENVFISYVNQNASTIKINVKRNRYSLHSAGSSYHQTKLLDLHNRMPKLKFMVIISSSSHFAKLVLESNVQNKLLWHTWKLKNMEPVPNRNCFRRADGQPVWYPIWSNHRCAKKISFHSSCMVPKHISVSSF